MDSGATDHVCSNLALFHTYTRTNDPKHHITIPDGRHKPVKRIASVQLTKYITLTNVFHIPNFQFNLLLVHKFCHDLNCYIIFTHSKCYL